jgi:isoleucyl-tRNA synthetase
MEQTKKAPEISYKDTLNLPKTSFPMRPTSAIDDPALVERWKRDHLFEQLTALNRGEKQFILHDGPPYANGNLHIGHAYNKILKDIISKAYRMAGYHVPIIPGWDCHGLPIELKVSSEKPHLDKTELIAACRDYAQHWIEIQRTEAERMGIVADFNHAYVTMNPEYEGAILEAFATCVSAGTVARLNKTVAWCTSCQTVLASAEIEYADRRDPSIIVRFDLAPHDAQKITGKKAAGIAVWTTTPWTLPLNRGVMIHPDTHYAVCSRSSEPDSPSFIIGETRVSDFSAHYEDLIIERSINASALIGLTVKNPISERVAPIIADRSVGLTEGTAAVHIAPGCGPIDYEIGIKNGLEVASPITPDGKFDESIDIPELRGISVTDAQGMLITRALQRKTLIHKASLSHSYPHCWRCRNGLIFRATPQWFIRLDDIKEKALSAIAEMTFVPTGGKNFLSATVENRWEWCISRQRTWGVPIPALLCTNCGTPHMPIEQITHVAEKIKKAGVEWWWSASIEEIGEESLSCAVCSSTIFTKETAILDVWFDSGISHTAVLKKENLLPADLYLEGIDQHRGWFQSSLLTSIILNDAAPMKTIMSHGYVVDAQGHKMSKSRGNVIAPQQVIDKIGTDGLRLWVSSIDYDGEIVISEKLIAATGEAYRKIRNTLRGLMMNLYDFNPEIDAVAITDLTPFDQYFLTALSELNEKLIKSYLAYNITGVMHAILDFCTHEVSAFYLDIMKDRLYCDAEKSNRRRSAQTVIWHTLTTLNRLCAPIISFAAEYISDISDPKKRQSIHAERFTHVPCVVEGIDQKALWSFVRDLRDTLLKTIERQREAGTIRHSLEAELVIFFDPQAAHKDLINDLIIVAQQSGSSLEEIIAEIMIVSKITLIESLANTDATDIAGVSARAHHARGIKCPRCWKWHENSQNDGLCGRCLEIIMNKKL